MSRVRYAFDPAITQVAARPAVGFRVRLPVKEKLGDRRYLKTTMETIGLFLFGFGASSLVMHLGAGYFLTSSYARILTYLPF